MCNHTMFEQIAPLTSKYELIVNFVNLVISLISLTQLLQVLYIPLNQQTKKVVLEFQE